MSDLQVKENIFDIDLKICYGCNLNCLHCAVAGKSRSHIVSLEKIIEEIDYFKTISSERIIITGGEPTLHPKLISIVNYASYAGFKDVHLQTNAILLSDKIFVSKLQSSGLTSALVSLHGHIEEIHDSIVNKKGAFRKTILGIHNLLNHNINISTNTVIRKKNINFLPEFIGFINAEFGNIRTICFSYPRITGGASENFYEVITRYSEISPLLNLAFDTANSHGIWCWVSDFPLCLLKNNEHHNSDVIPRNAAGLDPSKKDRVNDYQMLLQTQKIKTDRCQSCYLSPICLGIDLRYYQVFGDKELIPYDKP